MENETIQFENIKKGIDEIIFKRSEFLISRKFTKCSMELSKIYSQFNINKSKRIDALGAPQIDVNYLDQVIILSLKAANLFLIELSSPKDIFISFFLITSQKENEMEGNIKLIKQEIISKNLTEKYNNIFYEEKIEPMLNRYKNDNKINNNQLEDDETIHIVNIAEYNAKGIKIKSMNEVFKENENNIKEHNIQYETKDLNLENKIPNNKKKKKKKNKISQFVKELNPNILFIETLPQILIDYLKDHQTLAFVEINEELTEELKLYNKDLLYKIKEYDELVSKNKKIENNKKNLGQELNQYSSQLKQVQKNINLYEQIIIDKKKKNENTIFLEDMLNKLKSKKNEIINNINEINKNSFASSIQEKFNKFNNISPNKFKEYWSPNKNIDNIIIQKIKIKEIPKLSFDTEKLNFKNLQSQNSDIKKLILPKSTSDIKFSKFSKFKIIDKGNQISQFMNNNNSNTNLNNNSNTHNNTNNYNKHSLSTKDSIFTTISNMEKDSYIFSDSKSKLKTTISVELSPDLIETALNEIFSFYSKSNNNSENDNNNYIFFDSFKKFCRDFKLIFLSDSKKELIFYETLFDSNDNENNNNKNDEIDNNKMNINEFKTALSKISLEMHEINKQKLKQIISDKKNVLNYVELREYLRQAEEKNHNKFTEKITGGISQKNKEQNQFEFLSKYKKLKSEIIQYEFEYKKQSQKTEHKILKDFYNFLGIGNYSYKNKIKIRTNIFVENALKKYGHMNIFKNYQNFNNISVNAGFTNHFNFNTNSQTINTSKKNIFTKKLFNRFKFLNNYNYKNNNYLNESNLKKENNKFFENNNMANDRYNVKSIDDLEEINSKGMNNKNIKNMSKNFSASDFKIKGFENINMNILPSINGIQTGISNNHSNIRYNLIGNINFFENINNI